MFIARRLQLPVFGVNMPIHFMLAFVGEKEEQLIDPYDQGAEVSYDQCYFFLKRTMYTKTRPFKDGFRFEYFGSLHQKFNA